MQGKIERVWVVRNPTKESILEDICTELSTQALVNYIRGTVGVGLYKPVWESENTTLYLDEKSAHIDADARLTARDLGVL